MNAKTVMLEVVSVSCALLLAPVASAEGGLATVPDVRVKPLVHSHWGQAMDTGLSNRGEPCFNFLTPKNYRAGCSAVPMAQIMRYWRYPSRIAASAFACQVDGAETSLSSTGEEYAWDDMPGVTTNGTTEAERYAIGTLMRDCAISLHSYFARGDTTAYGTFAFVPLRNVFKFKNAVGYGCRAGTSFDISTVQGSIFASLDAGAPVIVSLCQSDPNGLGHMVVADGYGFKDGKPYVHLNLGYCDVNDGVADAWYALPDVVINTHDYDKVDGIVYNIFPENSGDVLSGRVLWKDGAPVAGIEVTARLSGKEVGSVSTDSAGIYAFVLPGGKTYSISAGDGSRSVALTASVSADVDWSKPFAPFYRNRKFGTPGNSWGNDLTITSLTPPPGPEFGGFMPKKAATLTGVVYDESDVPCGTLTLKAGKMSSKRVSTVSGTIQTLDGKKYTVKSYKAAVVEGEDCEFTTAVTKFGTLSLRLGDNGFAADISCLDGSKLHAKPADITTGFPKPSTVVFSVSGLPSEIAGQEVLSACTPDGEPIEVNAKGKWTLRKAASPKLKKIRMKGENGKSYYKYELQGLDDPKKPNKAGLKLTYTAKSASFKGSFALYCNTGTKLAKYTFTVNGLVLDGVGVGRAVCKKPAMTLTVNIH